MKFSKLLRLIVITLLVSWIVLIPLLIVYKFSNYTINLLSLMNLLFLVILYFRKNIRKFIVFNFLTILFITYLIIGFYNSGYLIYLISALIIEILVLILLVVRKQVKKELFLSDKILKFIVLMVPLIIISYLLFINVSPFGKEINDFVDIGKDNVLTPKTRISENIQENNINYVNQIDSLIYFDSKIPWGTDLMKIQIKVKDDFPEEYKMLKFGGKDQEVWHYQYKQLYNPILDNLNDLKINSIYSLRKGTIIATDKELEIKENKIENYIPSKIEIFNSIRGSAIMYIYAKDNLNLEISKLDINWYDEEDPLEIYIYNSKNELIGNTTLQDDGITDKSKISKDIQTEKLNINNITEGVYKIQLKGTSDTIITNIKINQNKVIFDGSNILFADNQLYNLTEKETNLYTKTNRNNDLTFLTYHNQGIQNITINNNTLNINQSQIDFTYNLIPSDNFYEIKIPKNDLVLKTVNYISFSKEAYFEPYEYRIVPIVNNETWLRNNVDYILTDYQKPVIEGDWIIGTAEFNIKDLYIKNNKINFLINTPHLANEQYKNYTIPIDYINITYIKEPIWK